MENLLSRPKSRKVAGFLALLGTITPLAGLHKFLPRTTFMGNLLFPAFINPYPPHCLRY